MRILRGCLLWLLVYGLGFVALSLGLSYLLRAHFPPPFDRNLAMILAGLCVLLSGFFWQAAQAVSERSLLRAAIRGRPLLRPGRLAVAAGPIQPLGEPLESPFSGTPCVAFEYDIADPKRPTESGPGRDYTGMALSPCQVRTQGEGVRILGWPQLEGFLAQRREGPDAAQRAARYVASTPFERVDLSAVLGMVRGLLTDDDGAFKKDLQLHEAPADLAGRALTETAVRIGAEVCAYGEYDRRRRGLVTGSSSALRLVAGHPEMALRAAGRRAMSRLLLGTILLSTALAVTLGVAHSVVPSLGEALISYAREGNTARLQQMVSNGVDVDSRGLGGETALMFAESQAVVRLLVAHGADVNATDLAGKTPLMHAAAKGNHQLIEVLLGAGADPTVVDSEGKAARDQVPRGNQRVLEMLD